MKGKYRHIVKMPIRWCDQDALGHVNNATYFVFFEIARINYFEETAVAKFWDRKSGPVLASASCNYIRALKYPATIEIGVRATDVRGRSLLMEYAVFMAGTETLIAEGSTAVVWVDYAAEKSTRLPEPLKKAILDFESGEI